MTAKTSNKAFREISDEGILPNLQFRTYNYITCFYGRTGEDIERDLGASSRKRIAELYKKGLIEHCGTTKSHITGKIVYKWRATSQQSLPYQEAKKSTRAQLISEITLLRKVRDEQVIKLSEIYDSAYKQGQVDYTHGIYYKGDE